MTENQKLIFNVVKQFLLVILALFLAIFSALLSGTILWLIWPVVISGIFPGLVASGVVVAKITWWQAVCCTWLFNILIKNTQSAKCPCEDKKENS